MKKSEATSETTVDFEYADICKVVTVVLFVLAVSCGPKVWSFRPGFVIAVWLLLLNSIASMYLEISTVPKWRNRVGYFSSRSFSYGIAVVGAIFHPAVSILVFFPKTQNLGVLAEVLYFLSLYGFWLLLILLKRGKHPAIGLGRYLPLLLCLANFLLSILA